MLPSNKLHNLVTTRILDFPSFDEVIHWDEVNQTTVILEKPQILESYILMPVFGFSHLDIFKRKLYVGSDPSGDDTIAAAALIRIDRCVVLIPCHLMPSARILILEQLRGVNSRLYPTIALY